MKSANSSSSLRNAWFQENTRRLLVIPIVSFLAYFLAVILPVILNYSRFEDIASYMSYTLQDGGATAFIGAAMAVVTSAAVFSYLHDTASAVVVHSMPFGRRKLYSSSVISGFIMMLIPIVATCLLLMLLSGAHVSNDVVTSKDFSIEMLTISHALRWMLDSIIVVTFVYTMSNLAGIIAGTRLIHVLLALFINGTPYALLLLIRGYAAIFFYGFPEDIFDNKFYYVSAASYSVAKDHYLGRADILPMLIYILVSIAIGLLTLWLYKHVKLERVRNACVFPIAADIICVLLTFMGMSLCAMLLTMIIGNGVANKGIFIALSVGLGIMFYIICRMIADSTTNVFNSSSYKKFGIYVVIVAVFFAFGVFDIAGYGHKTPTASKVSYVYLTNEYSTSYGVKLSDQNSINAVIALQKTIIDEHRDNAVTSNNNNTTVTMTYHDKNGILQKRTYALYLDGGKAEQQFKSLYDSAAFKKANYFIASSKIKEVSVTTMDSYDSDNNYSSTSHVIASKHYAELLQAANKDIQSRTYKQAKGIKDYSDYIATLDVHYYGSDDVGEFSITKNDTNTIKYLKSTGYWNEIKSK